MIKDLKLRIKGVDSIKKITKAMQMVSAANFRKVSLGLLYADAYVNASSFVLDCIGESDFFLNNVKSYKHLNVKYNAFYVLFTSDKGLCGSINSGLIRYWTGVLKNVNYLNVMVVGNKGIDAVGRNSAHALKVTFSGIFKRECNIFDSFCVFTMLCRFLGETNFNILSFFYNHFKTPVVNYVDWVILNLNKFNLDGTKRFFLEYMLFVLMYKIMFHNKTSEESSRMSSMETATQSADDMLRALTAKYNKYRQSAITIELIEIVSGAEAISEQ